MTAPDPSQNDQTKDTEPKTKPTDTQDLEEAQKEAAEERADEGGYQ